MKKKNIAVLFGGQSSEHEVSKLSVQTIFKNLSKEKYCILPIYITKDGRWKLYDGAIENINNIDMEWEKYSTNAIISPDASHKGIVRIIGEKIRIIPIDLVFSVIHGECGEDGAIQGLLEMAKIPYVGCGVFASAVAMDKSYTKILVDNIKIEQAKYKVLRKDDKLDFDEIEKEIKYPYFVKPSSTGSSKGISKVNNKIELKEAIKIAFKYGTKIIIEEGIVGREVECAVLGNKRIKTTKIGEILSQKEFYDYNTKYNDKTTKTVIPADLSEKICKEIQEKSVQIFKAIDGRGLARVDFFIEKDTERIIFNEINTMPGFTAISMYPSLWEEKGMSISELLDELICLAFTEFKEKNQIME